jgi:hypothetical protein
MRMELWIRVGDIKFPLLTCIYVTEIGAILKIHKIWKRTTLGD